MRAFVQFKIVMATENCEEFLPRLSVNREIERIFIKIPTNDCALRDFPCALHAADSKHSFLYAKENQFAFINHAWLSFSHQKSRDREINSTFSRSLFVFSDRGELLLGKF